MVDKTNSRQTPYDDCYGTCGRTDAKLLIYTGHIDPRWVGKLLDIEGACVSIKGQQVVNMLGRVREIKSNRWYLKTEGFVESLDLRRHLDWLLEKVEPRARELKTLQQEEGIQMAISCVWWSVVGHGGPALWPEQMERLAKLNLELNFDIYFVGEEESQADVTNSGHC